MKDFFKVMGGFVAVWTTAFLFFAWVSFAFWPLSSLRGWTEARIDLSRGHYRVLGYGLPVAWRGEYVSILQRRYGVELRAVAACTPSSATIQYADTYDKVSIAAIQRKFGRDALDNAEREAKSDWKSAHPARFAR
jgi:hypothetical protein